MTSSSSAHFLRLRPLPRPISARGFRNRQVSRGFDSGLEQNSFAFFGDALDPFWINYTYRYDRPNIGNLGAGPGSGAPKLRNGNSVHDFNAQGFSRSPRCLEKVLRSEPMYAYHRVLFSRTSRISSKLQSLRARNFNKESWNWFIQ